VREFEKVDCARAVRSRRRADARTGPYLQEDHHRRRLVIADVAIRDPRGGPHGPAPAGPAPRRPARVRPFRRRPARSDRRPDRSRLL
jgi:hypothetical protein